MDLQDIEQKVNLGLHYDNLQSLISECDARASDASDVAVGYYVIGSVLKELICSMDQQAVPTSALLSAQNLLTAPIIHLLKALKTGSKDEVWMALNSLLVARNLSCSASEA